MQRRFLFLIVLAAALAIPASASADTYCVPTPCSPGTPEPTVSAAVTAADTHAGPDTVSIGAGTFNLGAGQYVADPSPNPPSTEIVGAGQGRTILTADNANASSVTVIYGYMSRLANLTIRIPSANGASNTTAAGFDDYKGLIENVSVDAVGSTFGAGINDGSGAVGLIRGGAIHGLKVDLPTNIDASGLGVGATGSLPIELRDIDITAPSGIASSPQKDPTVVTVPARNIVIHSPRPLQVADGYMDLSDALIDASMAPAPTYPSDVSAAITIADGRPPSPAGLVMDRVTLIGNGRSTAAAISLNGQGATPATSLRARHIVTSGYPRTIGYANYGSNPTAEISYSAVNTDPSAFFNTYPTNPATLSLNTATGNVSGDSLLGSDFRPGLSSPAVDIGGDDLIAGQPTDLAGNPRPVDGNGDGTVANDAGAYERQYTPDGALVVIDGKKVKLSRKGVGRIRLLCPSGLEQPGPCVATLALTTAKKLMLKGKSSKVKLAKAPQVTIAEGSAATVKVKLSKSKFALIQDTKKARKAVATVAVTDGNGESGTVTGKLKLKP